MASAAVTFRERSELGPGAFLIASDSTTQRILARCGGAGRGPALEVLFPAFAFLNEDFICRPRQHASQTGADIDPGAAGTSGSTSSLSCYVDYLWYVS